MLPLRADVSARSRGATGRREQRRRRRRATRGLQDEERHIVSLAAGLERDDGRVDARRDLVGLERGPTRRAYR
jgi:hypothetical protein